MTTLNIQGHADGSDLICAITVNTLNGDKTLDVPSDVVDSAVNASDVDGGSSIGSDWNDVPDLSLQARPDSSGYDYAGSGGAVKNDGEGYDDIIDPLSENIAVLDPHHSGIYVYHDDGLTSLTYSTGGFDWYGDVYVKHMDPETWGYASEEYRGQAEWLQGFYDDEPYMGAVEDDTVWFAMDDGDGYMVDMTSWKGDIYIAGDMYTFGDVSLDEAIEHLNVMLSTVGVD